VKFCFDNNLPPQLAHAIAALSRGEDGPVEVIHLKDRFRQDAEDTDWIPQLGQEGGWIVVSQDGFRKSKAERELMRSGGVSVYVLDPQWAQKLFWLKAERLVHWWPQMLQHARLASHFAVRVPWRTGAKGRFEQIRV
jgi:hypothetical protein